MQYVQTAKCGEVRTHAGRASCQGVFLNIYAGQSWNKVNERMETKSLAISSIHQYTLMVTMWTASLFCLFACVAHFISGGRAPDDENREETADRIPSYQIN